jgi:hypothetical protein
MKIARFALAFAAPLLLVSCFLQPGKFVSTLDIRKDRSFTFTYVGEIISADPKVTDGEGHNSGVKVTTPSIAETETQRRAIAEALSKEEGYRSVRYLGGDRFQVDYSVSGRLDRGFVYPLNLDAMAFIPWIAVEVRKDGTVRVKAPAFGDPSEQVGAPGGAPSSPAEGRDGSFTLTTDATLVMQNNEAGAGAAPGGGARVVWRVTPTSKTVPTAVVRF